MSLKNLNRASVKGGEGEFQVIDQDSIVLLKSILFELKVMRKQLGYMSEVYDDLEEHEV